MINSGFEFLDNGRPAGVSGPLLADGSFYQDGVNANKDHWQNPPSLLDNIINAGTAIGNNAVNKYLEQTLPNSTVSRTPDGLAVNNQIPNPNAMPRLVYWVGGSIALLAVLKMTKVI
ncbi:MAG: hypothetical protein FE834_06460 [Gammaproteobacteria bacterium]|nr:hypothetical protein [Gammaproteobacteria bacterium]